MASEDASSDWTQVFNKVLPEFRKRLRAYARTMLAREEEDANTDSETSDDECYARQDIDLPTRTEAMRAAVRE